MEEDVKRFIYNHGFAGRGDYYSYHISLGFYYAYTRDAYQLSEKVQDGEVFDDYEACTVIRNLELAKRAYRYFRNKLFPNLAVLIQPRQLHFMEVNWKMADLQGM